MRQPSGLLLVTLAALLSSAVACAGSAGDEPVARPAAQAGIDRLVTSIAAANRGGSDSEIPGMAEQLQREVDGGRAPLLQQLVLYLAAHPGNEPAMGTALLIDFYGFTDDEKIEATAPLLAASEPRLRDATWEVLSSVEHPEGARESAARVQELERLLASEASGADETAEARREVETLSRDASWWIRLYVAHLVRSHPELGSAAVVERLRADEQPRVREAAGG